MTLPAVQNAAAHGAARHGVFPVEPPDGAVVGPRPVFQIGYVAPEGRDAGPLRFRIELRPDRPGGRGWTFDQRRRRHGWSPAGEGRVIYRPPRPIADGVYEWSAAAWDGVAWVRGERAFALRIDSVPPADVQGLRFEYDPERDVMLLRWDPVSLDRDGSPEYVTRYHVYRYTEREAARRPARALEIGVTGEPWLVLDGDPAALPELLYYEVIAEDRAGNQPGRRGPTSK